MLNQDARDALNALYGRMDEQIADMGSVCNASGRCCRFKEYGHTLFLSELEAERLLEDGLPPGATIAEDRCPFQIQGLCTARDKRPLGCRVYFCDPDTQEAQHQITEAAIRELKEIHEAHHRDWNYRPLHYFFPDHSAKSIPPSPDNPLVVLREIP